MNQVALPAWGEEQPQRSTLRQLLRYLVILLMIVTVLNVGCGHPAAFMSGDQATELVEARHGGAELFIWGALGMLLFGAVIIDVLLLPAAAYHYDYCFPCSRAIVRCY